MVSKQDETFLAIAQAGSGSKAAQGLYLSQPAVSRSLKRLEEDLGAQLFDREAVPLRLTQAGERYLRYVLERTGGKVCGPDGAESLLHLKRSTIYLKLKKYGIIPSDFIQRRKTDAWGQFRFKPGDRFPTSKAFPWASGCQGKAILKKHYGREALWPNLGRGSILLGQHCGTGDGQAIYSSVPGSF